MILRLLLLAGLALGLTACGQVLEGLGGPRTLRYETSVENQIQTHIPVEAGDRVEITATGTKRFGLFAGVGGPDGIDGFAIYNKVSNGKHGCLLARVSGSADWYVVGSQGAFEAGAPGTLELTVNDTQTSDNEGSFQVKVTVIRR